MYSVAPLPPFAEFSKLLVYGMSDIVAAIENESRGLYKTEEGHECNIQTREIISNVSEFTTNLRIRYNMKAPFLFLCRRVTRRPVQLSA
jgi:hypothetical protein